MWLGGARGAEDIRDEDQAGNDEQGECLEVCDLGELGRGWAMGSVFQGLVVVAFWGVWCGCTGTCCCEHDGSQRAEIGLASARHVSLSKAGRNLRRCHSQTHGAAACVDKTRLLQEGEDEEEEEEEEQSGTEQRMTTGRAVLPGQVTGPRSCRAGASRDS